MTMKIPKHITLWDMITDAISDLEFNEPKQFETDRDMVSRLIDLAYHYRFECKRLEERIDELEFNMKVPPCSGHAFETE